MMSETQIWEALIAAGEWQAMAAGGIGMLLWVYRYWAAVRAIDTWKEVGAVFAAVGGAAIVPLSAGSDWKLVVVTSGVAAMGAILANSGPIPVPKRKEGDGGTAASLFFVVLLGLGAGGCTPKTEALTAHSIGIAVDVAGEEIAYLEKEAGLDAIEEAKAKAKAEDRAPTEQELDAATDAVEAKWRPVYRAHDAFKALHATWVELIGSGHSLSKDVLAQVLESWCTLRALVVEFGVGMPRLLPCEAGG